ncbi:hypothetical protein [Roseospira navarrensis]|uniref:Uncharacterized protein n=1 Tax=Roseospira navarrensis TaxID=140058 RepID=A0A7X1ZBZ4_9PROT|nr:hypothetical protein [Roseospira navarrensis]MQX35743.1 hypothetical protein [Roseospira navarrensis]
MITLYDCCSLCEAVPDEVEAVASHERLPPIVATGKVSVLLRQPWGAPAVRQMILDEFCRASERGDRADAMALANLVYEARRRHPGGHDRRLAGRVPPSRD